MWSDLKRYLVQSPAQIKVSLMITPGCLELYPVWKLQKLAAYTLPLAICLSVITLTLKISPYLQSKLFFHFIPLEFHTPTMHFWASPASFCSSPFVTDTILLLSPIETVSPCCVSSVPCLASQDKCSRYWTSWRPSSSRLMSFLFIGCSIPNTIY